MNKSKNVVCTTCGMTVSNSSVCPACGDQLDNDADIIEPTSYFEGVDLPFGIEHAPKINQEHKAIIYGIDFAPLPTEK